MFYDPEEAHVAAGFLRSNGFDVLLADAETISNAPFYRFTLGGIKLLGPPDQVEDARQLLATVRQKPNQNDQVCSACGGRQFSRVKKWRGIGSLIGFMLAVALATKSGAEIECTQCKTKTLPV